MKIIKYLALVLFFTFATQSFGTNPIAPSWSTEKSIEDNNETKNNLIEKLFHTRLGKWVTKKIINAKITSSNTNALGITALIVGIACLVSLFLIFSFTWGWWLAFGLAILGDILSIITLVRTSKHKKDFKKARTFAWVGLIFSLLTGILPLTLFILILISI